MVGISITSAPISRRGAARPPDCLLARVVKIRQPLRGSSALALLTAFWGSTVAAFFVPVDDLFAFMAVLALPLPARIHRSESYRPRASAKSALFPCPVSRHQSLRPVRVESRFRPGGQPSHEEIDGQPASQHTLLWAPGNPHPSIPAARARNQWRHACRSHSETTEAFWSADRRGESQSPARLAPRPGTSRRLKYVSAHADLNLACVRQQRPK